MTTTTRKVPVAACQLRAGVFELLASGDEAGIEKKSPPSAKILARSGKAIQHWYWGKLVHDFGGMAIQKERLALDYCHDQRDIIGFAEGWGTDGGDLTCTGTLLTDESERAAEIARMSAAGVPYEASITFQPLSIEELDEGRSAEVNGQLVEGPAAIVRRWELRGLAVCPHGADPNTRTELSASAGEIDVSFSRREGDMSDKTETVEQIAARVQQELTGRINDYLERFGQQGQAWALSNRPLVDCYQDLTRQLCERHAAELAAKQTEHAAKLAELQASLDAKTAEAKELSERLAAISLGEKAGAGTAPKQGDEKELTELQASLGPNLARFVAAQRASKARK